MHDTLLTTNTFLGRERVKNVDMHQTHCHTVPLVTVNEVT